MSTKDYCTKTEFISRENIMPDGYWGIALDIGYSAVKGMSPNSIYCFPSYARKRTGPSLSITSADDDEILFRDSDGTIWEVGALAQRLISATDTNDSLNSLYGRNRYYSDMFRIVTLTGIGIGLRKNNYGNPKDKTIMIQTGLPPAYLSSDAQDLKEVIGGHHCFALKIGKRNWYEFDFNVDMSNIKCMAQPMGSLLSASMKNNATLIPESKNYLSKKVIVFDAGFGTVDFFSVTSKVIDGSESHNDCGMKAVFAEVSKELQRRYNIELQVHAMQNTLHNGYAQQFDRRNMKSNNIDISEILMKCSQKVCMRAIAALKDSYNFLIDYDYLLVTGGTGAAWYDIICDHFAGMSNLKIITGTQNDDLSHIYSNVRGYFLYQASAIKKLARMRK